MLPSRVSRTLRWNRGARQTFVAAMTGGVRSPEFGSVAGQALSREKIAQSSRVRVTKVSNGYPMARSTKLGNDQWMTETLKLRAGYDPTRAKNEESIAPPPAAETDKLTLGDPGMREVRGAQVRWACHGISERNLYDAPSYTWRSLLIFAAMVPCPGGRT